jgi:hypothetical protein
LPASETWGESAVRNDVDTQSNANSNAKDFMGPPEWSEEKQGGINSDCTTNSKKEKE